MQQGKQENKFQAKTVSIVALSHFTHDIYTAFLAPLLPLLIERLQFSYSFAGFLIMLMRFPSLFNPLFGLLAEKINTRYFVIFTPAITAIAMSFIPNVSSELILCILLLIAGTSSAIYHIPAPVMVRHLSGNKIGRGMSFFMLGGELARTIGPILILSAIGYFGVAGAYKVVFIGLIVSIYLFFKIKNISIRKEFTRKKESIKLMTMLKRQKHVFVISGVLVTSKSFMIIALTSFLPTYMTSKGSSIWLAGAALSIIELAGAAGTLISGTLSDHLGRRTVLMITTIFAPLMMIIFVFISGWVIFPVLIILGLLVFAASPVIMAYVQDNEKEYPVLANSIFMTLNFLAGSIVALLFGVLGDAINLDLTYIICAILSFIAIPFIFKMPKNNMS